MSGAPPVIISMLQQGLIFFYKEEWDSSFVAFRKVVEAQPDYPVSYFFLSLVHLVVGEEDKAQTSVEKGLSLAPNNALGKNILAVLAFRKKQASKAFALLGESNIVEEPLVQAFLLLEIEKIAEEIGE